MSEWNLNYLPLKSLIRPRRDNVSKNWKSCEGQKPSEGSNPSHCARKPLKLSCFRGFIFTLHPFLYPFLHSRRL